jgi:hypothetical protein
VCPAAHAAQVSILMELIAVHAVATVLIVLRPHFARIVNTDTLELVQHARNPQLQCLKYSEINKK